MTTEPPAASNSSSNDTQHSEWQHTTMSMVYTQHSHVRQCKNKVVISVKCLVTTVA